MVTEVALAVCQVRSACSRLQRRRERRRWRGVVVPRLMLASFDGGPYSSDELYARTTK